MAVGIVMYRIIQAHSLLNGLRRLIATTVLANLVLTSAKADFKAVLDRTTIGLGETVNLNLVFEDGTPTALSRLPSISNLDFVSGPSQSSQYNSVNGVAKSTFTVSYTLRPRRQGDYEIPSFQAEVGGKRVSSQPITLHVIEPISASGSAAAGSLAYLRLVVPTNAVYVGETFPVEMQIYVLAARNPQPHLNADGFTLGKMVQAPVATTVINNQSYQVVVLRWAATAAKVGELPMGPAECALDLQVPVRQSQTDPFDPFNMFGPRYKLRPAHLQTPTKTVDVQALPEAGRPVSFNGAVGNYHLTFEAGPTNLSVGDPITARITLSGEGAIDSLVLPDQPQWKEFKTYPPTSKTDTTDQTGTAGSKTFEQVLVPQDSSITSLPPLQFSYFNPDKKRYITLASPEIPLHVAPAAQTPQPTLAANTEQPPEKPKPEADIIHIRPRLDDVRRSEAPLVTRPWFVAAQTAPLLAWLALLVRRKRIEWMDNNPRVRRRREAEARVREGLRQLQQQAQARSSEDFFATLFRVLQEKLGGQLDLPASAITAEVIDERLRPLGVNQDTLTRLGGLFEACDQARFAPDHSSGELAALIPQTEAVLKALDEVEPS